MSDSFYIKKRDRTAHRLLTKFGFDMTLVSQAPDIIDPDSGVITTVSTPVNTVTKGIMRFFSQDEIDGQDILSGDLQVLFSAKDFAAAGIVPDTTMRVVAKAVTYFVVRNTPTTPGGIDILYRLQVRR